MYFADGDNQKRVKNIIEGALRKAGFECNMAPGTYDSSGYGFKVTVLTGTKAEAAQHLWNRKCYKFGLESWMFGGRFFDDGEQYEVVEIRPRARKYPVGAKRISDGKIYVWSGSFVASKLRAARKLATTPLALVPKDTAIVELTDEHVAALKNSKVD